MLAARRPCPVECSAIAPGRFSGPMIAKRDHHVHDSELIHSSRSRRPRAGQGPTAPFPRAIARASWPVFGVLVYLLVATFIYRASWSTITADSSAVAGEESRAETRIKYDHFTYLGLQYYERQDYRMAEWAFRKSTEYGPDRPLAYNNLGSALNAQGRWNEAIAVLEHALSLDPTLAITRKNLDWARDEKAKQGR